MFIPALRVAIFFALTAAVFALIAISSGRQVETAIMTEYAQINDIIYTVRIRDLTTNTYTELAGTRCFPPLPLESEWLALRQQYQPNYVQQIQVRSFDAENALSLLRCPQSTADT